MMPTRLNSSGTFPGLILKALALSSRGGEHGAREPESSSGSLSGISSRSSMNSPTDIVKPLLSQLSQNRDESSPLAFHFLQASFS